MKTLWDVTHAKILEIFLFVVFEAKEKKLGHNIVSVVVPLPQKQQTCTTAEARC